MHLISWYNIDSSNIFLIKYKFENQCFPTNKRSLNRWIIRRMSISHQHYSDKCDSSANATDAISMHDLDHGGYPRNKPYVCWSPIGTRKGNPLLESNKCACHACICPQTCPLFVYCTVTVQSRFKSLTPSFFFSLW